MSCDLIKRVKDNFTKQINTVPDKWNISEPLRDKVSEDSKYLPFYGYTSVFKLDRKEIDACSLIQKEVMDVADEMLIPLPASTFHVTAHEYANVYTVGDDEKKIDEANEKVISEIKEYFHNLNTLYGNKKITLKALGPSTSGSDVVSIKFIPDSEDDAVVLQDIFDKAEKIWPVGRKYTPHVSLGYFKLDNFSSSQIDRLYQRLKEISEKIDLKVSFEVGALVFQRHFSMEDFRKQFTVADMR